MSLPPLELDIHGVVDRDENVTTMQQNRDIIPVSPLALAITSSTPASPTLSDSDSESLNDDTDSSCSFTGEECPDFCGGPKNSCRSWTPPASPFYYTNEGGIYLVDDRQNFQERQKKELEHTLLELDERLQKLEKSLSPSRFFSGDHEIKNSTPLSPSGKAQGSSKTCLPSPTEDLGGCSHITTVSPKPHICDCGGSPRQCKSCPTSKAIADSPQRSENVQGKGEIETANLGRLIHTSLTRVQTTNSPPRYLVHVSSIEAQPPLKEPTIIPNSHQELRDGTSLLTRHSSPQLHLGNTAYPTPLPSSPEMKPSRKRGRDVDESSGESSGRKRHRERG